MYLLDTCVLSDFFKGNRATLARIKAEPPSALNLSSISLMEIQYGLTRNPEKAQKIKFILDDFLETIQIIYFSTEDAIIAGKVRAKLAKVGTTVGPYDPLIAASALNHNLTMVTSNMKEFTRIADLHCENWRINL